MKSLSLLLIVILFPVLVFAQSFTETPIVLHTPTGDIHGTLLAPDGKKVPIALIIAGSGPTDRNGNQQGTMPISNNSLKMLADSLAAHGIATVRFDKRGIGASKAGAADESLLRFSHYIDDAEGWVQLLKKDKRFNKVYVIGHSEGSLIGMATPSINSTNGFISLAGAGEQISEVLKRQLQTSLATMPEVRDTALLIIDKLKSGDSVYVTNPMLMGVFRPSVLPYIRSWFQYDPAELIAKMKVPILIVQGTTDIQVEVAQAELLKKANPKAQLVIIEGMNHIFKSAEADRMKNMQTYNDPNLPVMKEMITAVVQFINSSK